MNIRWCECGRKILVVAHSPYAGHGWIFRPKHDQCRQCWQSEVDRVRVCAGRRPRFSLWDGLTNRGVVKVDVMYGSNTLRFEHKVFEDHVGRAEAAAPLVPNAQVANPQRTLGGSRRGGQFKTAFAGEAWIDAGSCAYRVWVESDTVNFQRHDEGRERALGAAHRFEIGESFTAGREFGDYRIDDPTLSKSIGTIKGPFAGLPPRSAGGRRWGPAPPSVRRMARQK